ncbi:MAG TPA: hypothetical protein VFJ13_04225, partial [Paracoccaceae bacterium]|nr:hypothetical protein [Paracoccaceae bacterium]
GFASAAVAASDAAIKRPAHRKLFTRASPPDLRHDTYHAVRAAAILDGRPDTPGLPSASGACR